MKLLVYSQSQMTKLRYRRQLRVCWVCTRKSIRTINNCKYQKFEENVFFICRKKATMTGGILKYNSNISENTTKNGSYLS